jgi:antitoxin component of MazEF toxin-antitoxin module
MKTEFDARIFITGGSKAIAIPKASLLRLELDKGDIVRVIIEK